MLLSNVPEAKFTPGAASIPESRVHNLHNMWSVIMEQPGIFLSNHKVQYNEFLFLLLSLLNKVLLSITLYYRLFTAKSCF